MHEDTSNVFNMMSSNFLFPYILLPTNINTHNDTLIDNIFSNRLNPDIMSGNLTVGVSDHLPSFIICPKDNHNHLPKNIIFILGILRTLTEKTFFLICLRLIGMLRLLITMLINHLINFLIK